MGASAMANGSGVYGGAPWQGSMSLRGSTGDRGGYAAHRDNSGAGPGAGFKVLPTASGPSRWQGEEEQQPQTSGNARTNGRLVSSQAGQTRPSSNPRTREQALGIAAPSSARGQGMDRSSEQTWRGSKLPGPSHLGVLEERWPKEVLSHIGMAPQGLGRRPNKRPQAREPATSGLRLVAGACQIPHPNKAEYGGEDSYFISADGAALGVADGVGEWDKLGISTRPMADELMSGASMAAEELAGAGPDHPGDRARLSMRRGYSSVTCFGACTAIVSVLDSQGQCIGIANVGDSGLRQVRKIVDKGSEVVNATRDQQHFFNCPYQLTNRPYENDYPRLLAQGKKKLVDAMNSNIRMIQDSPDDADIYTFALNEGDVLILGSDGLFDNLHESEICDFVDVAITPMEARQVYVESAGTLRGPGSSTDPGALATTIAHAAYHRACDTAANTPFSVCARQNGVPHNGGKMDDITVLCAWVVRMSP